MWKRTTLALLLCCTNVGESRADDEGCTVILCLSNPAGWAAVAECVAPVRRALKAMAKGRVPQCTFSGGTGNSDARISWVPETVPATVPAMAGAPETVRQVRVLEYRDAQGTIQRIKF
jgi:hypothetical protein